MQRAGNSNQNEVNGPQRLFEIAAAIHNMTQEVLKDSSSFSCLLSIESAIVVYKNRGNISKSIQSISEGVTEKEKFSNHCSPDNSHTPAFSIDKQNTMSTISSREPHSNRLRCRYQHIFPKLFRDPNSGMFQIVKAAPLIPFSNDISPNQSLVHRL